MGPKRKQMVKQRITDEMIANFEANNRGGCLFCEADGPEHLEGYEPDDIPKGSYCNAFWCRNCGRAWREITRFEEISQEEVI